MLEVQSAYITDCFGIAMLKKSSGMTSNYVLPEHCTANGSKMSCRITVGWLSKYRLLLIELVEAVSMRLMSDRPNPAVEAYDPHHQ